MASAIATNSLRQHVDWDEDEARISTGQPSPRRRAKNSVDDGVLEEVGEAHLSQLA